MEKLTKEEMGEIALIVLKEQARKERIPDANNLKRNLGNASKVLGIPTQKLLSFWVAVYQDLFSSILGEAVEIKFKKAPKNISIFKKMLGTGVSFGSLKG